MQSLYYIVIVKKTVKTVFFFFFLNKALYLYSYLIPLRIYHRFSSLHKVFLKLNFSHASISPPRLRINPLIEPKIIVHRGYCPTSPAPTSNTPESTEPSSYTTTSRRNKKKKKKRDRLIFQTNSRQRCAAIPSFISSPRGRRAIDRDAPAVFSHYFKVRANDDKLIKKESYTPRAIVSARQERRRRRRWRLYCDAFSVNWFSIVARF